MVVLWALRLGTFLFARVRADGRMWTLDALKVSFPRFFIWTLRALGADHHGSGPCRHGKRSECGPGAFALAGGSPWLLGFILEVIADGQ